MTSVPFEPPASLPRSAAYPVELMAEATMGPNVLWLAESLTPGMTLAPGMRVLDLGCGRALSSIFLAREFGVTVTAADLWISPDENAERLQREGVADLVTPIRAEAHDLPFAANAFDAIVSLDAYHYFGTDDLYLKYLMRFLKPGGQFGIVVPGLVHDLTEAPAHLAHYWEPDFWTFHTAAWWRMHWEHTTLVDVDRAEPVPDGAALWLRWSDYCAAANAGPHPDWAARESEMLRTDAGRTLNLIRMVATKR